MTDTICPYCRERGAATDDHIFPEFLGGNKTIRACRACNSTFGHSFEGRLHRAFAPLFVALGTNGAEIPDNTVWRKGHEDSEGRFYDLHPGMLGTLSRVSISEPDGAGTCVVMTGDGQQARRIASGFIDAGRARSMSEVEVVTEMVSARKVRGSLPVNDDLRRLAIKMLVGLCRKFSVDLQWVSEEVSSWLVGTSSKRPCMPARFAWEPSLSSDVRGPEHVIYVETSADKSTVIGVVTFFDLISIYVCLSDQFKGTSGAFVGRSDLLEREEYFGSMAPFGLAMPATHCLPFSAGYQQLLSRRRFDALLAARVGALRFGISPDEFECRVLLGSY